MVSRRVLQSLLALALCVFLAVTLGTLYLVAIVVAAIIATASGVYVLVGLALGLMWPVLVVAYVMHITVSMKLRTQQAEDLALRPTRTTETGLRGVEDPHHREN